MYMAHPPLFMGIIVIAAGLITLHFANKDRSTPLAIAAWLLILGGILGFGTATYYNYKFWQEGGPGMMSSNASSNTPAAAPAPAMHHRRAPMEGY